jgi:host factor-I protein
LLSQHLLAQVNQQLLVPYLPNTRSWRSRYLLARAHQEAKNMSEKAQNVQDVFLNHLRKNKTPVTIFLVNGVKLQGVVTWFDNFCVLLRRDGQIQLVYKHAISTVMPGAPVQLFDGEKGSEHGDD